ncbi:hypothetical protein LIER_10838 [Lithospermum erythrorhizon]|uniref:Integrase catalytic domain-containing protein n=1 Tax=Lithospermum erythrorhizon TaxID=34254 RepID=A0AAV3PN38_LITER
MLPEDEEKTAFITVYGLYCWKRMVNSIFASQIGRNMEIYVDDMLVKSRAKMSQERFTWDEESNKAFAELKEYLGSPQLLSRLESGETLQLYLVILDVAVSSVLIREEEGIQKPIYYVNHVLRGVEERYHVIDKDDFSLVIFARKLKDYFESHPIQVGQALSDFVIECTAKAPLQVPIQSRIRVADPQGFEWSLHVDGARNDKGAGVGVLITGLQGIRMEYALRFEFPTTNNEVEYEAMTVGLKLVKSMNITEVLVKGDSKLVIDQIQGYYWPTLVNDALSYVKKCDACQQLGNAPQQPVCSLTPVVSPIPFAMWGIDLVRKLPKGRGRVEFAIVAVDYFSKWVEAVPLKKTRGEEVTHFLWKDILTWFGIPKISVSDNGPN